MNVFECIWDYLGMSWNGMCENGDFVHTPSVHGNLRKKSTVNPFSCCRTNACHESILGFGTSVIRDHPYENILQHLRTQKCVSMFETCYKSIICLGTCWSWGYNVQLTECLVLEQLEAVGLQSQGASATHVGSGMEYIVLFKMDCWLVVSALWKIWVRQLGSLFPIYIYMYIYIYMEK